MMTEFDNPVPLPGSIDDEYLREDTVGSQPVGLASKLDALIVTIKIFQVIEKLLKIKYTSLGRGVCLPELAQILQLDGELDEIEESLPAFLKLDDEVSNDSPADHVLRLQAEGVSTRYAQLARAFAQERK
jgi:hypothetical protein